MYETSGDSTCGPFMGGGKWCMRIWSGILFWLSYSCCELLRKIKKKARIVDLDLNLTCWNASGVKGEKKEKEILHGYFIHSMSLFTDDKQKSDQYQIRPVRLINSCFHMVQWLHTAYVYLIVNCLSSNCFQRAAATSTPHPREPSDSSMPIQSQKCSAARSLVPIVYFSGGG